MKIVLVAGARPNFMKIAPVIRAIGKYNAFSKINLIEPFLVHTGQHYDYEMSRVFFKDLDLPKPDEYLGVGSATHAQQTARVMTRLEKVLIKGKPDLVFVVGDVNSTLAGALAAVKLNIPVAHVEAGLRSFDKTIPEEINRLLTDHISNYLFTTSKYDDDNLLREGISAGKIFCVGNVMADSLIFNREMAGKSDILSRLGLREQGYALMTLHRPSNVDNKGSLTDILTTIVSISKRIPVIFPVHPRTRKNIKRFRLGYICDSTNQQLILTEPLGYLSFLNLEMNAKMVITDSGGVQVETTVFGIPCLSLLDTPVWTVTHETGTNTLVGSNRQKLIKEALNILDGKGKKGTSPELWDGKAAERIVAVLAKDYNEVS